LGLSYAAEPAEKILQNNPFRLSRSFPPAALENLKAQDNVAGSTTSPRQIGVSLQVLDKEKHKLSDLSGGTLQFAVIKNGKRYALNEKAFPSSGSWLAWLDLPSVPNEGWADLEVRWQKGEQTALSGFQKNAFYYREDKLDLLVLIDDSGSMTQNDPTGFRLKALRDMVSESRLNGLGEMALLRFADKVETLFDFVPMDQARNLLGKIPQREAAGGTAISSALKLAIQKAAVKRKLGHEVGVILLTDGVPSEHYQNEHLALASLGVRLYPVGLRAGANPEYDAKLLGKMAKETGGLFFEGEAFRMRSVYENILRSALGNKQMIRLAPIGEYLLSGESLHIAYRAEIDVSISVQDKTQNRMLEPVLTESTSKNKQVWLEALSLGDHELEVRFQNGDRLYESRKILVHVISDKRPCRLMEPLVLRSSRAGFAYASVGFQNDGNEEALARFHFLKLKRENAEDNTNSTNFISPENSFASEMMFVLPAKTGKYVGIGARASVGFYSGSFLLEWNDRAFFFSESVDIREAEDFIEVKQGVGDFSAKEKPFFSRRFWLSLLAGLTSFVLIFGICFILINSKKNV
jgi:hypothetical protein